MQKVKKPRKKQPAARVPFRPQARLLYIVGSDLIKDEMAGIIELVKNSYDADAKQVTLSFKSLDGDEAGLILTDDGHGMSRSVLLNSWMSPATGAKEDLRVSPKGRAMLGRKGVGRFSAMRLGHRLVLDSNPGPDAFGVKARELGQTFRLRVNWDNFERSSRLLDQVPIEIFALKRESSAGQGLTLTIEGLREQWDEARLERLTRELKLLYSPLIPSQFDDFTITVDLTNSGLPGDVVKRLSRKITPYTFPSVIDYEASAEISASGEFRFDYERRLFAERDNEELEARKAGENIADLFGEEYRNLKPIARKCDSLPCGPLKVVFHIWDRDIELLHAKNEQLGKQGQVNLGVARLRKLLDEISGVAIYRDGFRVRPYGLGADDWLGMGQRRVQRGGRMGPNQLFGIISISASENPELDDQASREGLKENTAFIFLKACLLSFLAWIEPLRHRFRERNGLGRQEVDSTRQLLDRRKKLIEDLDQSVRASIPDTTAYHRVRDLVKQVDQISDEEHQRLADQAEMMHDLHGLGLLARFIIHEGRNLDGSLNSALKMIERLAKACRREEELRLGGQNLVMFDSSLQSSRNSEKRLEALLDQLDPITRPRRRRRPSVALEEMIGKVISTLRPEIEAARIEIHQPGGEGLHNVLAWEADVFHAIYNLVHNSIYWVQRIDSKRSISITVAPAAVPDRELDRGVEVRIADNGPGVSEVSAQSIFELGYTERSGGYGMGLFIAREAVERSGGKMRLVNPGEKGALFRIEFQGA